MDHPHPQHTHWMPHFPHLSPAAHDAARRDEISWVSLIRTARVSYAFQALVALGLLLPPQMRDMLAALTEAESLRAWAAFPASIAVFGFLSWYWARATISARFDLPDTTHCWNDAVEAGRQGGRPFIRYAPLHIVPQAPIPIAGVTGLLLAWQSRAVFLGLTTLALLLLVWFAVSRRQRIRAWLQRRLRLHWDQSGERLPPEDPRLRSTYSVRLWLRRTPYRLRKVLERAPSGAWPASLLLALSMLTFTVTATASWFPAVSLDDPRNLIWTIWHGPTPVLLGCALMIGPFSVLSFILDGLRLSVWIRDAPLGLDRPPIILCVLGAGMILPHAVSLHAIRTVAAPAPARPALAAHFAGWQSACGKTTRPVIVAVSGGAARAALWGAAVLARVDIEAEGSNAAIYGIVTVSGGSLGAATYLSARAGELAPQGAAGTPSSCRLSTASAGGFEAYARALASADAIGPLLAGFVLSDVPRGLFGWLPAMLGAPMRGGDRAAAIERGFEVNATEAARRAGLRVAQLDQPYLTLAGPGMPLWLAQATARDTGGRVLISPVEGRAEQDGGSVWPFQGASDLLAQLGADIPISTAVNATARFPFLEPSGTASSAIGAHTGLALIDGGYYDDSGLETALELASWLRQHGADPIVVAATGSGFRNGMAHADATPPDSIVRCGGGDFRPDLPPPIGTASDVLAPLIGLYQVRAGHVDTLLRRARAELCPHQAFFHFYLGARGAEPVPLNWVLSRGMAAHVWRSAGAPPDAGIPDVFIQANSIEAERLHAALRVPQPESHRGQQPP